MDVLRSTLILHLDKNRRFVSSIAAIYICPTVARLILSERWKWQRTKYFSVPWSSTRSKCVLLICLNFMLSSYRSGSLQCSEFATKVLLSRYSHCRRSIEYHTWKSFSIVRHQDSNVARSLHHDVCLHEVHVCEFTILLVSPKPENSMHVLVCSRCKQHAEYHFSKLYRQ